MAERCVLRLSADDLTGSSERDGADEAREESESRGTFLADDRVFADGVGESVVSVERDRRVAAPAKQSVPGRTER